MIKGNNDIDTVARQKYFNKCLKWTDVNSVHGIP